MNSSHPERETLLAQVSRQAVEFTSTSLSLPRRLETALSKLEQGSCACGFAPVRRNACCVSSTRRAGAPLTRCCLQLFFLAPRSYFWLGMLL
jgi:hypothetical protein